MFLCFFNAFYFYIEWVHNTGLVPFESINYTAITIFYWAGLVKYLWQVAHSMAFSSAWNQEVRPGLSCRTWITWEHASWKGHLGLDGKFHHGCFKGEESESWSPLSNQIIIKYYFRSWSNDKRFQASVFVEKGIFSR